MKLKTSLKAVIFLLFCLVSIVSEGKSRSAHSHKKEASISAARFCLNDEPVTPHLKIDLFEGLQVITQQAHNSSHTLHIAYLQNYGPSLYIKCINFFSGHNNQRFQLFDTRFLFPFHGFW